MALRHRPFRTVFLGAFLPHTGTWLRLIVLTAYAYDITDSAAFVGQLVFVYLAPVIVLGMPAGLLLDRRNRRNLLIVGFAIQGALSAALAAVAWTGGSRAWLLVVTAGLGVCNAVFLPAYSAMVPNLVPRDLLGSAISLMSAQQNATRVLGPVLAGLLLAVCTPAQVFLVSGAMALAAIASLLPVRVSQQRAERTTRLGQALLGGVRAGQRNRVIGRGLVTVTVFSFVCLFFVNQLPVIAEENLSLEVTSSGYGFFYAAFGVGAVLGALANGTVLAGLTPAGITRWGMVAFAAALAAFAIARDAWLGSLFILLVGVTYLGVVTAMTSAVQLEVADSERGRVSTLWAMGYAGSVGVSNLVFGPLADAVGPTAVLLLGALVAVPLAWYADLRPATSPPPRREAHPPPIGPASAPEQRASLPAADSPRVR
ncbi:MAG: MFS transporter [Frankia sp.]|nr:MFS transporter [Frankia sp.]